MELNSIFEHQSQLIILVLNSRSEKERASQNEKQSENEVKRKSPDSYCRDSFFFCDPGGTTTLFIQLNSKQHEQQIKT